MAEPSSVNTVSKRSVSVENSSRSFGSVVKRSFWQKERSIVSVRNAGKINLKQFVMQLLNKRTNVASRQLLLGR
ncbi:MAG: hypothetical protein IT259_20475 [Saprospiraceae bacterium]|nr:hypothetical protein [Saprospiraceae bacterium]